MNWTDQSRPLRPEYTEYWGKLQQAKREYQSEVASSSIQVGLGGATLIQNASSEVSTGILKSTFKSNKFKELAENTDLSTYINAQQGSISQNIKIKLGLLENTTSLQGMNDALKWAKKAKKLAKFAGKLAGGLDVINTVQTCYGAVNAISGVASESSPSGYNIARAAIDGVDCLMSAIGLALNALGPIGQAASAIIGVISSVAVVLAHSIVNAVEEVDIIAEWLPLTGSERFAAGVLSFLGSLFGFRSEYITSLLHAGANARERSVAFSQVLAQLAEALMRNRKGDNENIAVAGGALVVPEVAYNVVATAEGQPPKRSLRHMVLIKRIPLSDALYYLRQGVEGLKDIITLKYIEEGVPSSEQKPSYILNAVQDCNKRSLKPEDEDTDTCVEENLTADETDDVIRNFFTTNNPQILHVVRDWPIEFRNPDPSVMCQKEGDSRLSPCMDYGTGALLYNEPRDSLTIKLPPPNSLHMLRGGKLIPIDEVLWSVKRLDVSEVGETRGNVTTLPTVSLSFHDGRSGPSDTLLVDTGGGYDTIDLSNNRQCGKLGKPACIEGAFPTGEYPIKTIIELGKGRGNYKGTPNENYYIYNQLPVSEHSFMQALGYASAREGTGDVIVNDRITRQLYNEGEPVRVANVCSVSDPLCFAGPRKPDLISNDEPGSQTVVIFPATFAQPFGKDDTKLWVKKVGSEYKIGYQRVVGSEDFWLVLTSITTTGKLVVGTLDLPGAPELVQRATETQDEDELDRLLSMEAPIEDSVHSPIVSIEGVYDRRIEYNELPNLFLNIVDRSLFFDPRRESELEKLKRRKRPYRMWVCTLCQWQERVGDCIYEWRHTRTGDYCV
ncbi:hypothetical protein [Spartinivicinus poritis]|uniref:Uncharacterized protein n=1 Tax=Spartinivicinus poritis TaxID=2994640 RepID=A0ABT5UJ97_9GAMM|nr:hypothetical protein [Spartinivicinus sp. A2-2]MDE1465597.1 hypothetical protein [Spartinivicinus sp. A2-2]